MYMTVKQAAEKWGISDRRVRILCAEGKVSGAIREGRRWMIPVDTRKPADGRFKATESLLAAIDRKKRELDTRRPLTKGEVERLTEEFIIEYTYNSNAIEGNKFADRIFYYNAFDEYHVKHDLGAMQKLFAGYMNARLDSYLMMLEK